jgi:hypothetical protein
LNVVQVDPENRFESVHKHGFLVGVGFELRASSSQSRLLIHSSSLFCSGHLEMGGGLELFARAGLEPGSSQAARLTGYRGKSPPSRPFLKSIY